MASSPSHRPRPARLAATLRPALILLLLLAAASAAAQAPDSSPGLAPPSEPVAADTQTPILPDPVPAAPPVAVPETATVEGRSGQHGAGRRFAATAAELHAVLAGDASDVLLGSTTGSPTTLTINSTSWPSPIVIEAGRVVTLASASRTSPSTLDWGRAAPAFTVAAGGALALADLVLTGLPDATVASGSNSRFRRPIVVAFPLSPGIAAYPGSAVAVVNSTAYVAAADCAAFQPPAAAGEGNGMASSTTTATGVGPGDGVETGSGGDSRGTIGALPTLPGTSGPGPTPLPGASASASTPAPPPSSAKNLATHLLTRPGNTTRSLPARGSRTGADLGPITVTEANVLYVCSSPGAPAGGTTPRYMLGGEGGGAGEQTWVAPPVDGVGDGGGGTTPGPARPHAAAAPSTTAGGWMIAVAVLAGVAAAALVAACAAGTALLAGRGSGCGGGGGGGSGNGGGWWKWRRPTGAGGPPSSPTGGVTGGHRPGVAVPSVTGLNMRPDPTPAPTHDVRPSPFAAVAAFRPPHSPPSVTTASPRPLELALAATAGSLHSPAAHRRSLGSGLSNAPAVSATDVLPRPPGLRPVRTASTPLQTAAERVANLMMQRSGALHQDTTPLTSSIPDSLLRHATAAGPLGEVVEEEDDGGPANAEIGTRAAAVVAGGEKPQGEEAFLSTPAVADAALPAAPFITRDIDEGGAQPAQSMPSPHPLPGGRPPLPPATVRLAAHAGSAPLLNDPPPGAGPAGHMLAALGPMRGVEEAHTVVVSFPKVTTARGPALATGAFGRSAAASAEAAKIDIAHLEIGPLVGRGSFGSCYKVKWYGAVACLKVMGLAPPAAAAVASAGAPLDGAQVGCGGAPSGLKRPTTRLVPGARAERELVLGVSISHPNCTQTFRAWIVAVSDDDSGKPALPDVKRKGRSAALSAPGLAVAATSGGGPKLASVMAVEKAEDAAGAITGAMEAWAGEATAVAGAGGADGGGSADGDGGGAAQPPQQPPPLPVKFEAWILMEFCSGGSLDGAIRAGRFHGAGSRPSPGGAGALQPTRPVQRESQVASDLTAVFKCLRDVAAGMDYLHGSGILHGDLKPCNVLLKNITADTRGYVCKLADFGLARVLGPAHAHSSHASTVNVGTVAYAAPEAIIRGHASRAADVYSFGILAWEVVTGVKPWAGLSVGRVVHEVTIAAHRPPFPPGVPRWIQLMIERCWAADTRARPPFSTILAELQKRLE